MIEISERIRKEMREIMERMEDVDMGLEKLRKIVKESVAGLMETVEDALTVIRYGRLKDRQERETDANRTATTMDKIEERLIDNEKRLEDMRQDKERTRKKESVCEMADKIRHANRQMKVIDLDFGGKIRNRKEIVEKVR